MSTTFCTYCGRLISNTVGIDEDQREICTDCFDNHERDPEHKKV